MTEPERRRWTLQDTLNICVPHDCPELVRAVLTKRNAAHIRATARAWLENYRVLANVADIKAASGYMSPEERERGLAQVNSAFHDLLRQQVEEYRKRGTEFNEDISVGDVRSACDRIRFHVQMVWRAQANRWDGTF